MDLWTELLALLSQVVTPIWAELIQYIPLLFLGLIPLVLLLLVWMWQRHSAINRSRVPRRLPDGVTPEGLHLPSPSIWPLVGSVGAFFIFLSLVTGSQAGPNLLFIAIGLAIGGVALVGWLLDAGKEYAAVEAGDHHLVLVAETEGRPASPEVLPEGIHLPAPSAWPFLAPIGLFFAFLGLALGPLLIAGGLLMAFIAMVGWMLDAGKEYHEVADGLHPDPADRDPERHWPRRLIPVYGLIGIVAIALTMAPWALSLLPRAQQAVADAIPATTTPYVSAVSVLSFEQDQIAVPADTPFTITFENKQAGVPHNVEIFTDAARSGVHFLGELITGPATIEYQVEPLAAGSYPFICTVHPPMVGTLIVR
jgi:plastocyanin